jgi:3-deoxy-7-phosphoheptulonate synthase
MPNLYALVDGRPRTVVDVAGVKVGGNDVVVMAGPCAVESERMIFDVAQAVARSGACVLRGGAFKPRTSPYSFQGLGVEALRLLRAAADANGLKVVSEIMDVSYLPDMERYVDLLQIGARNMQNFSMLREIGRRTRLPVLLKRGISATVDEWLAASEYVLAGGNAAVILCERGVRGFEPRERNMLDVTAIPVLRELTHLPVIVDPSHATGRRSLVSPVAAAAIAAGADGLLVEVHDDPTVALSDGEQSLDPACFEAMMNRVWSIGSVLGRSVHAKPA